MSDHALEISEDITDQARAPVAGLPVDPKTELAVIAVAIRSSWALHVAAPLLPIEAFTVPRHKRAWRAILALRKAGETPDVTTVAAWLRERKLLEAPDANGNGLGVPGGATVASVTSAAAIGSGLICAWALHEWKTCARSRS